jgi:hypothetical protein
MAKITITAFQKWEGQGSAIPDLDLPIEFDFGSIAGPDITLISCVFGIGKVKCYIDRNDFALLAVAAQGGAVPQEGARIRELEAQLRQSIQNNTQLQQMAYNTGLAAGKVKDWIFLDGNPDNLPEEGQRVIVLYRNGDEDLIDAADFSDDSVGWWHTDGKTAYDRNADVILAWMPTPGVAYDADGLPVGLPAKERVRKCGHAAVSMVRSGNWWRCCVCGGLMALLSDED